MELKHGLIGAVVLAGIVAAIFGMISVNASAAISRCEKAGYAIPEKSMSITSCPPEEDYAHDKVALVVGNVTGSPKPVLTDEADKYLRNSLASQNGDLDIFLYSAVPGGQRINTDGKKVNKSGNVNSFLRNSTKKIDSIGKAITQTPVEDGADYFNNVISAAKAVKSSPSVQLPLVIVIGSGLSDTQPLNFAANDLLHADPAAVRSSLKSSENIIPGDLAGVKILWSGLGVTSTPQQPLDAKEKSNLKRIYTMVFEYMGATFVTDDTVMTSDSIETDYKVQPVKVNGLKGGVVIYRLGENSISFNPNSAQVNDVTKANVSLTGIVSNFKTCREAKVTVEGYQAQLQGEAQQETSPLSKQRAEAVKNLLIDLGIPGNQISAVGKGSSDFEGRVSEINAEGKWDDKRAQANRIVLIKMASAGVCN